MTKYIALSLLVAGVLFIRRAWKMNERVSFEDGSFLGVLGATGLGVACIVASMGAFAIAGFLAL